MDLIIFCLLTHVQTEFDRELEKEDRVTFARLVGFVLLMHVIHMEQVVRGSLLYIEHLIKPNNFTSPWVQLNFPTYTVVACPRKGCTYLNFRSLLTNLVMC